MRKGSYFLVQDSVEKAKFLVEFSRIVQVQLTSGQQSLWLRIRLLAPAGDDPDLLCPLYMPGDMDWIPLGHSTRFVIERLLHMVPHPLREGVLCYNIWLKREIMYSSR
jgi:hypothetical protein